MSEEITSSGTKMQVDLVRIKKDMNEQIRWWGITLQYCDKKCDQIHTEDVLKCKIDICSICYFGAYIIPATTAIRSKKGLDREPNSPPSRCKSTGRQIYVVQRNASIQRAFFVNRLKCIARGSGVSF